jgi:hypothetical protein
MDLLAAKRYLAHGVFIDWVEQEVGMPARTAQVYMQVAQWISGKSATVAHLPLSVLYVLSARNTPEQLVSEVMKDVEAGKSVTSTVVRQRLKAMREVKSLDGLGNGRRGRRRNNAPGTTDPVASRGANPESAINELIRILARALPAADFERVREIFASDLIKNNQKLGRNINIAFGWTEETALESARQDVGLNWSESRRLEVDGLFGAGCEPKAR